MGDNVKCMLKDARDAIKNKDYDSSLKICKKILNETKDNYTALVFLGVTYQETGQSEKALGAFKKAISIEPTNTLAWNGLVNFYEKNPDQHRSDLVKTYLSLLDIETNEKKLVEYCQKLVRLHEHGDSVTIVKSIYNLIKNEKNQDLSPLWVALLDSFSKIQDSTPEDLLEIHEEALTAVLSNQKTISIEYYSDFLSLLYRQKKFERLFDEAKKMHALFENDSNSLKWICKIYNEIYIQNNGEKLESDDNITKYQEKLLRLEQGSSTAQFTQSLRLYEENKMIEAKEVLNSVVKSCPGLSHAWILLARICIHLHLGNEAIEAVAKIEKFSKSISEMDLRCLKIKALVENDDFHSALDLFNASNDEIKEECLESAIKSFIALGKIDQAKLLLIDLTKLPNFEDDTTHKLLSARLHRKRGDTSKALSLLQDNQEVSICDWWLEMGSIHWDTGDKSKSLIPFLKAAKLEPTNYKAYLHLGNYYNEFANDFDKARRCYEKAFKINSQSPKVGIELSKIYRKLKNFDANAALLQSLTAGVINKRNCWAWIQLGLNYLEQQDYDKAVNTLRYVIRIDEDNSHCWESLADAYLAKGAYTSALKCYTKATEQCNSVYGLLQMASIKQILGEFTEARSDFNEILMANRQYVPALKGIAETCMSQARECRKIQRLGMARDHAQFAANKLIMAIQQRADLSCLWKLLGDCCCLVGRLPEKYCCLLLQEAFVKGEDTDRSRNKIIEKDELYTLAIRCYCKSLTLIEDNVLIWHDLSSCYLSYALDSSSFDSELISKAEICALHCVETNPTHWQHWNLLANIEFNKNPANYKLVQHVLIKSVIADNNSATAWCNLGTLYLILGDFKLANEAFSQAQRSDPNYINSWIGQAIVAENFNHEDAMDLFRHSTQLGMHLQGALGYGHWVCRTLKESRPGSVIYSIHNMHAIPVACDNLTWYTENNSNNPAAWNMLGLLKERLGLKQGALESFKTALSLTHRDDKNRDKIRINYGRVLEKVGKLQESVTSYTQVETATKESVIGLALTLFKAHHYEESYEAYNQALHYLADDERSQSDLLVALASMAYKFQGREPATTLLFQSIQLEEPSPWGFYATLALGLLHKDFKLSQLVYYEKLRTLQDRKECLQHYATLTAYLYILQGESKKAVLELSKLVHRHPDQACVWLTLAMVLVRIQTKIQCASKCAQIAMRLGQNTMDVTKVLCFVSLSSFVDGDLKNSLLAAQKAVHCYPNIPESWIMLITTLSALKKDQIDANHLKSYLEFSRSLVSGTMSNKVNNWLESAMV